MTNLEKMEYINSSKLVELAKKTGLDPLEELPYYLLGRVNQRLDTLLDYESNNEAEEMLEKAVSRLTKELKGNPPPTDIMLEEIIRAELCNLFPAVYEQAYMQALMDYDSVINKIN